MNYTLVLKLFLWVAMAALWLVPIAVYNQTRGLEKGNSPSRPIFNEISNNAGLKFRHYNGMTGKLFLPEIMGAGAALFDFDKDGDLDMARG